MIGSIAPIDNAIAVPEVRTLFKRNRSGCPFDRTMRFLHYATWKIRNEYKN